MASGMLFNFAAEKLRLRKFRKPAESIVSSRADSVYSKIILMQFYH